MITLDAHRDAVIVVDVQNDICGGGATVSLKHGERIFTPPSTGPDCS